MKHQRMYSLLIASTLILSTAPLNAVAATSTLSKAKIVSTVNFRELPTTSGDQIRYLRTGETVSILEKVNSYWYKVKDVNGRIGYVSTSDKYIEVITSGSTTSIGSATIVRSVSFRTGPSTNYSRIRYLQTGESVTILEKTNAWWYKVKDKNGKIGYVSTSPTYISTKSSAPNPYTGSSSGQAASKTAQQVIDAGMKYLGTPYEYGSSRSTTTTFDCSDFVRQAFLDGIGLKLPADSRQQGEYVKNKGHYITDWHQLKPGDIIFFMSYKGYKASDYAGINKATERITHDAIYLGNGKVLHTYSKESGGVKVTSIDGNSWEYRIIFGGSPL